MRTRLARCCAAVLAVGFAALPALAQQNNVALKRRLALSDPPSAAQAAADPSVRPASATHAATQPPSASEVLAGDATPRQPQQPLLQPVPARPISNSATAPQPQPQITQPATPRPPQRAAAASVPVHSTPIARQPFPAPQATLVHERRATLHQPQPTPAPTTETWSAGEFGDASCNACDPCGDDWFGDSGSRGRWFAGVDFIFARPHFSEPTAYILHQPAALGPGNVLSASDTWVYHNFDYEPSVRGYVGYRLDDCCAELRASYQRLDSNSSRSATTDANATAIPTYFEVQPGPGDTLTSSFDVAGDVFDVDFSRCIRAGGECIPCDCRTCPDWDLQWSAGARLARWDLNADVFTNDPTDGFIDIDQEFVGAGPKIGLEGRRYFGRFQQFTLYSTFDAALLVGWYEHAMSRNTPSVGVNPATIESFENKMTRTIPVTEIEVGLRWQPYERLNISAGWFFQAWWDLGMSTQATSNLLGGLGPQFLLDDSNIMSWDGLTVRAELRF